MFAFIYSRYCGEGVCVCVWGGGGIEGGGFCQSEKFVIFILRSNKELLLLLQPETGDRQPETQS